MRHPRDLIAVAASVITLSGGPVACVHAQPSTSNVTARADTATLHRVLDSIAAAHHGTVGYSVTNLETGEHLERRGDETFPTASLIKVAVLVTVFDLVEQKKLSLDDPLTVLAIDQVPGSGQLQFMHNGMQVTVRDAAWLMITLSDNTATNLLLDRIVIRRTWAKMEALGLRNTKIHSKVFNRAASVAPDSSVKYGLGVTTPNEMAKLFTLITQGKAVSPRADSMMLDMLEHNEDGDMMQRFVYGTRAAHKTGSVDQARTECSMYFLPARVAVCAFTKENVDKRYFVDNEGQVTIARIGEAVVRAWRQSASATKGG